MIGLCNLGSLTGFSLFHCRRPFISERLQEKKKEKFGNVQDDFTGPSDAFDAPLDLQGNTGGKDLYFISPMDNTAVSLPPNSTVKSLGCMSLGCHTLFYLQTSGEDGSVSVESPQATSVSLSPTHFHSEQASLSLFS